MNVIHLKRFNKLIDFIKETPKETIELRRKDIAAIVGVSEGDSLKKIFKILNEEQSVYSSIFKYKNEKKKHCFKKVSTKEDKKILELHLQLRREIKECFEVMKNIKRLSIDDYEFCKNEFKNEFLFISLFIRNNIDQIQEKNKQEYINFLNIKIDEIFYMYNALKLYYVISA